MYCKTVNECFQEINSYCTDKTWGLPLLVNLENYNDYQTVLQRLEADASKQCIFVSHFVPKYGMPMIEDAAEAVTGNGDYVLAGASQAAMLQSEGALDRLLDELLGLSISGHAVILLDHCKKYIERYLQRDPRCHRRVLLVEGDSSLLPQIELTDSEDAGVGCQSLQGIAELLGYMERLDDDRLEKYPVLTVRTAFPVTLFKQSLYQVSESAGVFEVLCRKYPDLALARRSYGNEEQWRWLWSAMQNSDTFSAFVCNIFGPTAFLVTQLPAVMKSGDKNRLWLLWLSLQIFGAGTHEYLDRVLKHSESADDFVHTIYCELLTMKFDDPLFETCYAERKWILESMPENLPCITDYCDRIGVYEKNAVYYLTSGSERERYELMRCLGLYEYREDELMPFLKNCFQDIYCYMQPFVFDELNMKLPLADSSLRSEFTSYFSEYKMQKLTNRVSEDFLLKVNRQAVDRPFMKLQPRSSILSKIDKTGTGFFFFDALGVEYLAYIRSRCEAYDLISEISVGRCELPSITSANKEFENTCPNLRKISELDELKHHSKNYDYTACRVPIHLFCELEIIDTELRRIHALLSQGNMEKAVIFSDHGASRLAVLYGKENASGIELAEKGVHSGRCCKIDENPKLPQVSYEEGYAVLANYERFKGGRAANLEVHGGGSLEEVLVPVITLTKMPVNVEYCFTEPAILLKQKAVAALTLYCNVPMSKPRLCINQKFYEGEFVADQKHAKFVLPDLKRSRSYIAEVYEGEKNLSVSLEFKIQKSVSQENDLFG